MHLADAAAEKEETAQSAETALLQTIYNYEEASKSDRPWHEQGVETLKNAFPPLSPSRVERRCLQTVYSFGGQWEDCMTFMELAGNGDLSRHQ